VIVLPVGCLQASLLRLAAGSQPCPGVLQGELPCV